jgi:hypothetical protein
MEYIRQQQIASGFQGLTLTEFSLNDTELSDINLIGTFIKSENLTKDCIPEKVKKDSQNQDSYLRPVFNDKKIFITDFKSFNKLDLQDFFNDFLAQSSWAKDKSDFIIIFNRFKIILDSTSFESVYLISKDWFDEESEKLREPESWIYIYYFLIIWIDTAKKNLLVCEWSYD